MKQALYRALRWLESFMPFQRCHGCGLVDGACCCPDKLAPKFTSVDVSKYVPKTRKF